MNKPKLIGYWVTTGLFAAAFLASGAAEIAAAPGVVLAMRTLGYPLYFLTILGVWKVLGAAALLAPRLPRLKEWAYAGIFFDLTGAAISHACSGDPAGKIAMPLVFLVLAGASWALRPPARSWNPKSALPESAPSFGSPEKLALHA
ncbi:MAG TPA: DoxX family protein [Polyangiaceae bacterium]|jgi:hypothetical protein|nr:DoxX family protein [Polyangiaceae bacterium]